MKVSVAVCTYRRYEDLEESLNSLLKQSMSAADFQVLVVDNSLSPEISAHQKKKWSKHQNFEYIITDKSGLSYARNVAIERSKSEIILYLDDDAIAHPNLVETVFQTFQTYGSHAAVVGGMVIPEWESDPPDWLTPDLYGYYSALDWGDEVRFIDDTSWLVGANIAYRTGRLRESGGFSENLGRVKNSLFSQEEYLTNRSILSNGYSLIYQPQAKVRHKVQKTRLTVDWIQRAAFWSGASFSLIRSGALDSVNLGNFDAYLQQSYSHHIASLATEGNTVSANCKSLRISGELAGFEFLDATATNEKKNNKVIYIASTTSNSLPDIDQTINSLRKQKFTGSLRLHIVDRESSDGTLKELSGWQEIFDQEHSAPRIIFSWSTLKEASIHAAVTECFNNMSVPSDGLMSFIFPSNKLTQGTLQTALDVTNEMGDVLTMISSSGTITSRTKNQPAHNIPFDAGLFFRKTAWAKSLILDSQDFFQGLELLAGIEEIVEVPGMSSQEEGPNELRNSVTKNTAIRTSNKATLVSDPSDGKLRINKMCSQETQPPWLSSDARKNIAEVAGKIEESGLLDTDYFSNYYFADQHNRPAIDLYLEYGWLCGARPNPFFYPRWYYETYSDANDSGLEPLYHYITEGYSRGYDPGPFFSTTGYLKAHPSLRDLNANPLSHFYKRLKALGIH